MISTNSSCLFINKIVLHREADFLTGRSAGTCLNWQLGPPEGLSYSRADLEDKQGVQILSSAPSSQVFILKQRC